MAGKKSHVVSKRRKGTPDWATAPFQHFLDEAQRLQHVLRLSTNGISMIRGVPKVVEALGKATDDLSGAEFKRQKKSAREDAKLAKYEVDAGFPILFGWGTVGLWALLEATIRNFVAEWLKHKRSAWKVEQIERLRIRIGEYEAVPKNQRHSYVTTLLEREVDASLKAGVSRFEAILEPFGLSGEIPDDLRRAMFEFSQVRNLITHNSGKVDRRFAEACPWLKGTIGSDFHVSSKMFHQYCGCSTAYVVLIICRLGEFHGVDMSEFRPQSLQLTNVSAT